MASQTPTCQLISSAQHTACRSPNTFSLAKQHNQPVKCTAAAPNISIGCNVVQTPSNAARTRRTMLHKTCSLFQADFRRKTTTFSPAAKRNAAMPLALKVISFAITNCGKRFCKQGLSQMIATKVTLVRRLPLDTCYPNSRLRACGRNSVPRNPSWWTHKLVSSRFIFNITRGALMLPS